MPACDQATCDANKRHAHEINKLRASKHKTTVDYFAVSVTLTSATPGELTFNGDGDNVTPGEVTFSSRGEDELPHAYRVTKDKVWFACPSTARSPFEVGYLYITTDTVDTLTSSDGANVKLKGSSSGALLATKWPDPGGSDPLHATIATRIWPTSILVRGFPEGLPDHSNTVELMDVQAAGLSQSIELDSGAPITLNLTGIGRGGFGLSPFAGPEAEAQLVTALERVTTKYHDDAEQRADAWTVITRWRRYLDWCRRMGHLDPKKRQLAEKIASQLAALQSAT